MFACLEIAFGLLIWCGILWDGFATIVLPRTVAPMRRVSGRFYKLSWFFWATVGSRIRRRELQLTFLAVYGPLSVMLLLVIWAGLFLVAFAMIYHGLGARFEPERSTVGFGSLLYLSGSTFLTLGLGDITSTDPVARFFMILESATGFIFLGLMISYVPLLHQAYSSREVGNMLIHSRTGHPPSAIKFLHRYSGSEHTEILRSNLRDAERWMATTLQSHLSHPVLSFYRAEHWGQSWLVSLTTILDTCALLIAGGDVGPSAEQARLTYRMGTRLLKDLTAALSLTVDHRSQPRLTADDLPTLLTTLKGSNLSLSLRPAAAIRLLRLVRRYDVHLAALSHSLVIPLPAWLQSGERGRAKDDHSARRASRSLSVSRTIQNGGLAHAADGTANKPPEEPEP